MVPGHYYLMDVYVISTKGLHKGLNKMYRCHISLVARVSSKDLVDYKGYFTKILFQGPLERGELMLSALLLFSYLLPFFFLEIPTR
jgi:hypothetical protein